MRVLVTGAYGLIGAACLARLHRDGHDLVGAGRRIDEARRRFPFASWRAADFDRLTTPEAWREIIAGVDAVRPNRRSRGWANSASASPSVTSSNCSSLVRLRDSFARCKYGP